MKKIKILFIRSKKAFLPEINAYIKYFNELEGVDAYDSAKFGDNLNLADFDVLWEFKGLGGHRHPNKLLIHDYASLSTGKFNRCKDYMKKILNPVPDLRLFLNKEVKNGLSFTDNIDYCYRDMGIDDIFINRPLQKKKEYDFVYIGAVTKSREIDKFLEYFEEKKNGKICLIGNVEDEIFHRFKNNNDIVFTGKVPEHEVPNIAEKAIYGLNYIPNRYPYNRQTSTKVLEYMALGLKVVSTDYMWVRNFEKKINSSIYYFNIEDELPQVRLSEFNFVNNFHAESYSWNNVIKNSKVDKKLVNLYKSR